MPVLVLLPVPVPVLVPVPALVVIIISQPRPTGITLSSTLKGTKKEQKKHRFSWEVAKNLEVCLLLLMMAVKDIIYQRAHLNLQQEVACRMEVTHSHTHVGLSNQLYLQKEGRKEA